MKRTKKVKTALAAVTASLLLATGLAGTANARDVWNCGVVYWTYSMATVQGVYSRHVLRYSFNDGTKRNAYGKWAPTYHKSYANAHGQPLVTYDAQWHRY
ncbi:hypothetical protein DSM100238_0436 [Bifidobacterium apri]|uniref:Lactococcin 972 family bacteriocin n=1 Tax=Bifidobacterium apri TaxID=1769423 RepID=A0A6A2W2R8_9BIFI|nr:hypothetical protein DSM100238_0436 [Bifidobacterium apri]